MILPLRGTPFFNSLAVNLSMRCALVLNCTQLRSGQLVCAKIVDERRLLVFHLEHSGLLSIFSVERLWTESMLVVSKSIW